MSKTIPVAIVDKNGRVTTVHRRATEDASAGASLPSPQIAPQNVTQGTPLEPVQPATSAVLKSLIADFNSTERYWNMIPQQLAKEVRKKDLTIIRRLLDNPDADTEMIKLIVGRGVTDETISKQELTNALLVAEQIINNGDGALITTAKPALFFDVALGAAQTGASPYLEDSLPISTKEELAGRAAIVTFVLLALENYATDNTVIRLGNKKFSFKWTRDFHVIRNRHLRGLIMERPKDQHAITDYVRSRGMHPANKKPVAALRAYLNEKSAVTAMDDGWL